MNVIQLREVDLNLLVILDALLEERSVSRAATRLHLTPSAVSHALKRLRLLFDDELLLRDGRLMRPTARADQLAESLPKLLAQLSLVIEPPEPFDAATSTRVFRLSAPDFIAPLMPQLLREVHGLAPGVTVELTAYTSAAVGDLVNGHLDALVANSTVSGEELRATRLSTWPWAVFARADHPAFDEWTIDAWSMHPHLQVRTSMLEGSGPTSKRAAELGVSRTVRAVVPHFSMAAPILAETDLLLTVPTVAMVSTAEAYGLEQRPVPFDLPPLELSLFRSAAGGEEPGVRWFRQRITAAFSSEREG